MQFQACFAGGNLLLGGVYLGLSDIYDLGLAVTDSCHNFYNTTKSGLGPLGQYKKCNIQFHDKTLR